MAFAIEAVVRSSGASGVEGGFFTYWSGSRMITDEVYLRSSNWRRRGPVVRRGGRRVSRAVLSAGRVRSEFEVHYVYIPPDPDVSMDGADSSAPWSRATNAGLTGSMIRRCHTTSYHWYDIFVPD